MATTSTAGDKAAPAPSLIEKMGGIEAASGLLVAAVESFYVRLVSDPQLATFFDGVHMDKLKSKQVDFLAYVFGGPNRYSGKDLVQAHAQLIREKGLDETHFDVVAGHFQACLLELGAAEGLVAEAVSILATARPIFERQPRAQEVPPAEDAAAIASQLQATLAARDADLAKVLATVRGLVPTTDAARLESERAALRLRGPGLVELFDAALESEQGPGLLNIRQT